MKKIVSILFILVLAFMFTACQAEEVEIITIEETKYVDDNVHEYGDWIPTVKGTCDKDGTVGHYHCSHCNKDFDEYYNELTDITDKASGHTLLHYQEVSATAFNPGTREYYECKKCHRYFSDEACTTELSATDLVLSKKVLTISDIKNNKDNGKVVTVRAVVIGAAGLQDNGYNSYFLKDVDSNEQITLRGRIATDNTPLSGIATCIKGYSYAPNLIFPLGSIIEIPVYHQVNTGSCGEKGKDFLIWCGDNYDDCYNFGGIKEWREKYIVGEVEDFSIDHSKVDTTITSEAELKAFLTGSSFSNKTICIESTKENPLKFITVNSNKNDTTCEELDREYLYFYYGDASSLSDIKIGKGYAGFSNFGNTYSINQTLSNLLGGQTEFEDLSDFSKHYEFVGKIYCTCVGGGATLYHFVIYSEDDIINEGTETSEVVYGYRQSKDAFFNAMEDYARKIGMNLQGEITTPVGIYNCVSIKDLARVGIAMTRNEKATELWSNADFSGTWKDSTGATVTEDFPNAIWEKTDTINYLFEEFGSDSLIGSKGGSLAYNEERLITVSNRVFALKGPNDSTLIIAICMNYYGNEHNYSNVSKEAVKLANILINKSKGLDTTALERSLDCASCAGVLLPKEGAPADGYDWWGKDSQVINYSLNGDHTIITASCWKMMTCITACHYITESDLNKQIVCLKSDLSDVINSSWPNYEGGEVVSLDVALHSMMRRSSNVSPTLIAKTVGEMILKGEVTYHD